MAIRRCPKCGLINPGTAVVCDCGWSFVDEKMGASHLPGPDKDEDENQIERRASGASQLAIGVLLLVTGVVITAATYGAASNEGGIYVIAYGPIVFGIGYIIRGLIIRNG